ncbi:prepilin-type cleavage/methylation domain-containing protein [Methylotenera sp.]|uniref:type IV pilus modification PilV family protein n=1 Tax=Methylotenera sp. TaxID=2051956 RepID=UPI002728F467|nr:prepilin-type cleavage/methylation domain-containing protein [Methylotenera sp.]MDO9205444.1 prepilin-type cleavage/methylation domain-containing protein [Methylotenera sp.]MDP3006141.1 prepilin-type cleavage/methylation domain-containing protein [Methylotenera sp.]
MLNNHKLNKLNISGVSVKSQRGIALLESLIGLLIFSMGILAIAGLQGFMIKGTTEAKNRSDASVIAQRRVAMMWTDAKATSAALSAAYAEINTVVPELPNGLRSTTFNAALPDAVTVTVTWQSPGEPQHNFSANARIDGAR